MKVLNTQKALPLKICKLPVKPLTQVTHSLPINLILIATSLLFLNWEIVRIYVFALDSHLPANIKVFWVSSVYACDVRKKNSNHSQAARLYNAKRSFSFLPSLEIFAARYIYEPNQFVVVEWANEPSKTVQWVSSAYIVVKQTTDLSTRDDKYLISVKSPSEEIVLFWTVSLAFPYCYEYTYFCNNELRSAETSQQHSSDAGKSMKVVSRYSVSIKTKKSISVASFLLRFDICIIVASRRAVPCVGLFLLQTIRESIEKQTNLFTTHEMRFVWNLSWLVRSVRECSGSSYPGLSTSLRSSFYSSSMSTEYEKK